MRIVAIFAATAVVALIGTGAMAQTTTPSATTNTPMTTTKTPGTMAKPKATAPMQKTAQTDISKACSAQADAKGLHGKERTKFRSQCKKNGGKM